MRLTAAALLLCPTLAYAQAFHVEESSIESTQRAIQRGETTCREVISGYIERARAYNGVCTALVTSDGTPIAAAQDRYAQARRLRIRRKRSPSIRCCRTTRVMRASRSSSATWKLRNRIPT
jgi:hypothetical protein